MLKFTRKEKLAIYYRLLAVLIIVLIAAMCYVFLSDNKKNIATPTDVAPTDITKPQDKEEPTASSETETTTPAVQEQTTAEPITEEPVSEPAVTIDDSYFDHSLFIGESRTAGLYYSGEFSSSDFLFDTQGTIGTVYDEAFSLNDSIDMTVTDALSYNEYDRVFLMFGMNELGWSSDDSFISYYEDLVTLIKEVSPDTTIYIQSAVYVTEGYEEEVDWIENSHVDTFNELMQSICDGETVIYLDVNTAMTENGYLLSENSTNGFQFTKEYMSVWKQALIDQLEQR